MAKQVSIFVAGAKELKTERYALKALAQELNMRYNEEGVDLFVEMKSYMDFKDQQTQYNNYIAHKADIVLFVLDGRIGDFTREEFDTAVKAFKHKQRPEIIVFVKNFEEKTAEIQQIEDLLKDRLGSDFFYVGYNDVADLRTKVETRITRFMSPTNHVRTVKKWRLIALFLALVALFAGLWAKFDPSPQEEEEPMWNSQEPMLLFLGGGSVNKFLISNGIDVEHMNDLPNVIYMGVPTGTLWNLLGEEWYKHESILNNYDAQKFFPVFFAANVINVETAKKAIPADSKINQNMLIFETFLGDDYIKVYIGDVWCNHFSKTKEGRFLSQKPQQINKEQLEAIISAALNEGKLYTTSPHSGTLKAFHEDALGKKRLAINKKKQNLLQIVSDTTNRHKVYHERTTLGNTNSDFVVLGSENYYPVGVDKNYSVSVVDAENNPICKQLYLYFVGYRDTDEGTYHVPAQVVKFLDIMQMDTVCWDSVGEVTIPAESIPADGIVRLRWTPKPIERDSSDHKTNVLTKFLHKRVE